MKFFNLFLTLFFLIRLVFPIYGQENTVVLKRTPEQEATKQTERLQQELNLDQVQANQIYEINLRYARERQVSNRRSEALERTKNKNAEIKQVLSQEQNERLQSKRFERTYIEKNTLNSSQSINPSGFMPSSGTRSNQSVRIQNSTNLNARNSYRPVNPNFQTGKGLDHSTRRSTSITTRTNLHQYYPSSIHSSSGSMLKATKKSETGIPHYNSLNNRQILPGTTSRKAEPTVNSHRK
ncbi:MAG: hypothetical protein Q8904_02885 [Bacteroidota bacterium]|nr:hypothetical protein [Bacteroidota bacterium]